MCTHEHEELSAGQQSRGREKERGERIAELLRLLEPELPSHLFQLVRQELEMLI